VLAGKVRLPLAEAADTMEDEMEAAAVTGQMVVASVMVSVTTTASVEDRAGQSVMVAAHEKTVLSDVTKTVKVV
jgi:hypothetical protein